MKKINLIPLLFLGVMIWIQITQSACTNDKLPEPTTNAMCDTLVVTYDNQVKPIVDASCAYAGCHFTNATIGDFTDYAKMTTILNDNKFKKRVLELKDMPEPPEILTDDELAIMTCWVANNYAE